MTRVAAIDCGTNSIRLLIADAEPADAGAEAAAALTRLTDVVRTMEVVRLGQGVDRTGEFAPEALARTLTATEDYAARCREHGVERIRFVATSATRDARNRDVFIAGVRDRLGVEPEVISGTEEAALSFAGAARVLTVEDPRPALVVDIGGGSTELVRGGADAADLAPAASVSMDIGCVRMTERHLAGDPPTAREIESARGDIRAAIECAEQSVPLDGVGTLVGVAGSVTTVTAAALGLAGYEPERINGARVPLPRVLATAEDLLHRRRAARAELGFMHPGRVDVIGAGALIWAEIITRVAAGSAELDATITSEHDILDGIALSVAARPD